MVRALEANQISHNDRGPIDRGTWRKFNPYNPWTEDKTEKEAQNLKVESLDDLFDDVPQNKETSNKNTSETPVKETVEQKEEPQSIDNLIEDAPQTKPKQQEIDNSNDEDAYDLQKELEAKFDELFGPLDEN